jgi:hypothetical protein
MLMKKFRRISVTSYSDSTLTGAEAAVEFEVLAFGGTHGRS